MCHKKQRHARVLDIEPDGKAAEIEFVEQHGELVVAEYMMTGPGGTPATDETRAWDDPDADRYRLPPPDGPETIDLPHRNPREARVLWVDPEGKAAEIEFVDQNGERLIGAYRLIGWGWSPAADRAKIQEILDRPPIVIYGRHPKDPRWRQ
jgi:hypothetical protein